LFPGSSHANTDALLLRARERFGARRWVVSDGAAPVWFLDETGAPDSIPTPTIREVSPTGSGDVMLAAILHAHLRLGQSWRDAVAWAVPLAAANAAHPGIAEFPLEIILAMSFAKPLSPRFYS
jgi:sugar/nucleoside kinase (ribokinase family)